MIGIARWAWVGFPLTNETIPASLVHRFRQPHSGQCHSTPPSIFVWMVFHGVALTGIKSNFFFIFSSFSIDYLLDS